MALAELLTTAHISTRFHPGDRLRDEPELVHLQKGGPCQVRFTSTEFEKKTNKLILSIISQSRNCRNNVLICLTNMTKENYRKS